MSGALNALLTIGGLAFAGWYLWTQTDFRQVFQKAMKPPTLPPAAPPPSRGGGSAPPSGDGGGDIGPGNINAGEGQTIFPSTGKKWKAVDSGKKTRNYASGGSSGTTQWDIKNVGSITNLEVTTFVNVGGCGDEVSLKVFGPSHSGSNCCWLIMNVDCNSGKFQLGGEGPHPDTDKTNLGTGQSIGSLKNKEVGIKLVVYKSGGQYTAIGYANTGGSGWKEMLRKSFAQWGAKKKSGTPHGSATIQFRTDCSGVKYRIAEAAEISPSGSAGFARAMNTRVINHQQFYYAERPQYSTLYVERHYNNIPSC